MLDAQLKAQIGPLFSQMPHDVVLTAHLDDSDASKEMRALLEEVVLTSPRLTLVESASVVERMPSFSIARGHEPARVSFACIPTGHEFTSLILGILHVGGHAPKIDAVTIEKIKAIKDELEFTTYVSLSCHNCPVVVQALNTMAALNPHIRHTTVDGQLNAQEVERLNILAVPNSLLNGEAFLHGRVELEEILAKLDTADSAEQAKQLSDKEPFDVLIVGGGPAGASAAVYAARKGIRTGIVAERFGGQVMDTLGIENLISVTATEGPKLVKVLEENVKNYGVDVMPLQRAKHVRSASQGSSGYAEVELENGAQLKARSVIISTGARWREMNVPGEQEYRNRGVAYCPHCDGPLFKGKAVAVIGGGNSGVEAAIDLAGIVEHVTLIEFDTKLRADAVLVERLKSLANATIVMNAKTTEVVGDGSKVNALRYEDRANGQVHELALAGVFVQIGLVPNTDFLKGSVELTPRGEILVNERGETSLPGVFAAGDCTTTPYKQIVISMGDGAKAALSAFDYLIRTPVVQPNTSQAA
jgi:alkyl hydroperoxide reductase subunit F